MDGRGSGELFRVCTYNSHQKSAVQEGAHATGEGDQEDERAGGHAKVAAPVIAINREVLSVDPQARVASDPERHGQQEDAEGLIGVEMLAVRMISSVANFSFHSRSILTNVKKFRPKSRYLAKCVVLGRCSFW